MRGSDENTSVFAGFSSLLLAAVVLLSSCGRAEGWQTFTEEDEWGVPTDGLFARSAPTRPKNDQDGPPITLFVSCERRNSAAIAFLETDDSFKLNGEAFEIYPDKFPQKYLVDIRVKVDGQEDQWRAEYFAGVAMVDFVTPKVRSSIWAAQTPFEFILPVAGSAPLVYDVNMSGAHDAITKACGVEEDSNGGLDTDSLITAPPDSAIDV